MCATKWDINAAINGKDECPILVILPHRNGRILIVQQNKQQSMGRVNASLKYMECVIAPY